MLELAFEPDRASPLPLYRQLEDHLRDLIESRRLGPAERLPPSRELARSLGLSRNTVNQAYQSLGEDGLLASHVGRGTFVAASGAARDGAARADAAPRGFAWSGLLSRRSRAVRVPEALAAEAARPRVRFDFRGGQVDVASLPLAELRRAYGRAVERAGALVDARDPRGWPPLREAVARSLLARGIRCTADDVAIVNGAQHGLDLVARLLVDPGETVVMEQPGYFGAAVAFAGAEAHLVGVGVDAEGLRTDELARLLRTRRVKLVFTTPAVQSPTGVALSPARRRELLALADEHQVPLVEDDYDSELRLGGPPVAALKNEDAAGQVVYVGTFTKALFGGLRVGYVVASRPLLARLTVARWASDVQTDLVSQAALADLLARGVVERHVRRVRRLYGLRRSALLAALERHLPPGAAFAPPAGGNTVWLRLPPGQHAARLAERAPSAGLAFTRGDLFHLDGGGSDHVALSFARLEPSEIEEGVARLAALMAHPRRARR